MNRSQWSGTTGHQFEWEFVAEFRSPWDGSYMPFRQALEVVRRNQPSQVVHDEGRRLLEAIAQELSVSVEELKFFTAAGGNCALDWFHGIDAFIDFRGLIIPFDFKMRKADTRRNVFFVRPSDVEEAFQSVVHDIAWFVRSKLARG